MAQTGRSSNDFQAAACQTRAALHLQLCLLPYNAMPLNLLLDVRAGGSAGQEEWMRILPFMAPNHTIPSSWASLQRTLWFGLESSLQMY